MQGEDALAAIPKVKISPEGIFKYILIEGKVHQNNTVSECLFVRGDLKHQYHADNFEGFRDEFRLTGWEIKKWSYERGVFEATKGGVKCEFRCPGGGRIEHKYKGHKCFVYGYSKSFGRVDHKIAQRMISEALGYKQQEIQTSQQGY